MPNTPLPNKFDQLQDILATMDVPEIRKGDMRWLGRNLGVQNANHPQYSEAMDLLRQLLFYKD
jgi:hypothetical protein